MTLPAPVTAAIERTQEALAQAEALVITAGAGMGVDSGLPDFRGREGFWRAYPVYRDLGLDFAAMANPRWFDRDPSLAWGFYGHRLRLYRTTTPHQGFAILRRWSERLRRGAFVFTSNVDGQFQRAGFDPQRVLEIHGSIHHVQCTRCEEPIRSGEDIEVEVDAASFRAEEPLPRCSRCSALLRPNILMFGDGGWDPSRTTFQEARLDAWLQTINPERAVVIECGAGTQIPSVRLFSERLARAGAFLARVNPREPEVPASLPRRAAALPLGAREALARIDAAP